MRPTVNDIAREAGVSLATVDRVLNARPGVRAQTIAAVNDAIQRIGYVRDLAAANLARGRSYRLAFALPDTDSQFVQGLVRLIADGVRRAEQMRTTIDLIRFPAEDPHRLAGLLAACDADGVAIMAPETPVLRDAVRALVQAGTVVVALVGDLPNTARDRFVGIDNRAAGRTAGVLMGRFLGGTGRIAVVSQTMQLMEAVERRAGFDAVALRDFPGLDVLPSIETHGQPAALQAGLDAALAAGPLAGVYLLGPGLRALTRDLAARGVWRDTAVISHELTDHARASLATGQVAAVVAQDPGHLLRSAERVLRARIDGLPVDEAQERIRIEVILSENLPAA
jgi:LacI family transcriptional regulator